jgi:hypothetical protein
MDFMVNDEDKEGGKICLECEEGSVQGEFGNGRIKGKAIRRRICTCRGGRPRCLGLHGRVRDARAHTT